MKRLVDQLDVAAVGLVAQQLQRVGDDLADEVAVVDMRQLIHQFIGDVIGPAELRGRQVVRLLRGFLALLFGCGAVGHIIDGPVVENVVIRPDA